ncbi:MAG TPA: putative glycoside hydrolase [Candidatus Paceibacterota bacterium]|nr:putative glycoside hydrolase [Candidatus Paceibacterota bacterium]
MTLRDAALLSFLIILFLVVGVAGRETAPQPVVAAAVVAPVAALPVHLPLPDPLHGLYVTAWTAGTPKNLDHIFSLFATGEFNAVVIDIKDASGRLSYQPLDPTLQALGVGTNRISDLSAVIDAFHTKGIYVIGRVSVFEDPFYAKLHPEDAFVDTRTGGVWTDYKGIAWLRPDSSDVEHYVADIAKDAYAQGFDEINLDYVRFPSDGALQYLDTSHFQDDKATTMEHFFAAIGEAMKTAHIPLSADVFGLTMSVSNDMGIGQKADLIAPSVDTLAPMVYPSHFGDGAYGIPVPAADPYDTIHHSLSDGIAKLAAVGIDKDHLRPWLQDFTLLGISYTPDMVRAQIQAAADLGIDSWVLWDPANRYTTAPLTTPIAKTTAPAIGNTSS